MDSQLWVSLLYTEEVVWYLRRYPSGVGFRNQGHFLRFLVWVDFGMAVHLVIILARMRAFTTWASVR